MLVGRLLATVLPLTSDFAAATGSSRYSDPARSLVAPHMNHFSVSAGRLRARRQISDRQRRARGHARRRSRMAPRSEEHTSELQSRLHLVCRLLLEKKKKQIA